MNLAIITHADDNVKQMKGISHPLIEQYADKCNADYINMTHKCDVPHAYRILKLSQYLEQYDRILNLDSDIIINKDCPNIFDHVPQDHIGTIYEDVGTRQGDRRQRIHKSQQKFGEIGWKTGYINTGVLLVSKIHQNIFQPINGELWMNLGYDDVHLGYNINKNKHLIHELEYKWNHMSMFSEPWNGNADRFKSHIIHYAGKGLFDKGNRIEQMKFDKDKIYVR